VRRPGEPPDVPIRLKGAVDLSFYVMQEGSVHPGVEGEVLREGDRIQFTYLAAGHESVVLLSIDGDGVVTVFYPEVGEDPEPVVPDGPRVLEGSIELDDAPGPEVFHHAPIECCLFFYALVPSLRSLVGFDKTDKSGNRFCVLRFQ